MRKIFAAAALSRPRSAIAVDSVSAELGHGTRGTDMWRFGAQWKQPPPLLTGERWSFYWDATVGRWESDTNNVWDVGLTPTLRYGGERGPYLDGGIGFHLLSDARISSQLDFSTKFQFGDHLGVGYVFNRFDLSVRLQHLSNAGIRNPNPGINFLQLRLQYWF